MIMKKPYAVLVSNNGIEQYDYTFPLQYLTHQEAENFSTYIKSLSTNNTIFRLVALSIEA